MRRLVGFNDNRFTKNDFELRYADGEITIWLNKQGREPVFAGDVYYELKGAHEVHVDSLDVEPAFRDSLVARYLLEAFVEQVLKPLQDGEQPVYISAYMANPKLREMLKRLTPKLNIIFEDTNVNQTPSAYGHEHDSVADLLSAAFKQIGRSPDDANMPLYVYLSVLRVAYQQADQAPPNLLYVEITDSGEVHLGLEPAGSLYDWVYRVDMQEVNVNDDTHVFSELREHLDVGVLASALSEVFDEVPVDFTLQDDTGNLESLSLDEFLYQLTSVPLSSIATRRLAKPTLFERHERGEDAGISHPQPPAVEQRRLQWQTIDPLRVPGQAYPLPSIGADPSTEEAYGYER